MAESQEKKTVLLIADISGYTAFMVSNAQELFHAQTIITELVKAVIKEVKIPLKIAKLEGDAVFFYADKSKFVDWDKQCQKIRDKIDRFFIVFSRRLAELKHSETCKCGACTNIDQLALKIIIHAGVVLFYKIGRFAELSGPAVILLHRLLKNSVPAREYVLLTEQALAELNYPHKDFPLTAGVENYDLGQIKTFVHYPPKELTVILTPDLVAYYRSPISKIKNKIAKMMTMLKLSFTQKRNFAHLTPIAAGFKK